MKRIFTLTLLFCLQVGLATAEEEVIRPELVQISTPVYHPQLSEFEPGLGTYNYTVSWQGIPAAHATVSVEREGLNYVLETRVRTYAAIRLFYSLYYDATGEISAVDLMPRNAFFKQKENSKEKVTKLTFFPNGEIESIRETKGKNTETLRFNPNNFTLDPFSAAFLARSLKWEKGEQKLFDTFNGKSRYLITLTAEDKDEIKINGEKREVWVIKPKVENLTKKSQNSKLRDASIYVSADKSRDILLIRSEVFIGSVKTKLESFTPSTRPVVPTSVADSGVRASFYK